MVRIRHVFNNDYLLLVEVLSEWLQELLEHVSRSHSIVMYRFLAMQKAKTFRGLFMPKPMIPWRKRVVFDPIPWSWAQVKFWRNQRKSCEVLSRKVWWKENHQYLQNGWTFCGFVPTSHFEELLSYKVAYEFSCSRVPLLSPLSSRVNQTSQASVVIGSWV